MWAYGVLNVGHCERAELISGFPPCEHTSQISALISGGNQLHHVPKVIAVAFTAVVALLSGSALAQRIRNSWAHNECMIWLLFLSDPHSGTSPSATTLTSFLWIASLSLSCDSQSGLNCYIIIIWVIRKRDVCRC